MRPRILVTGGTGLIGRAVLERLKDQHDVIVLSRTSPAENVEWLKADMSEALDASRLPPSIDGVIHLAQSQHFREFPAKAHDIFQVNVARLAELLDWARRAGAQRFIVASSGGIYGHGNNPFREDDLIAPSAPLGFYLASKQCSEIIAGNYASLFNVVILRFFFVYGAAQKPAMLIPRLIESIRSHTPIMLNGNEGLRLNPVYVGDAAESVVRALSLGGSYKINVAGPEVLSLRKICETIGHAVGQAPIYRTEDSEPRHIIGDIAKMCELLAAPRVGFEEGLRLTLQGSHG